MYNSWERCSQASKEAESPNSGNSASRSAGEGVEVLEAVAVVEVLEVLVCDDGGAAVAEVTGAVSGAGDLSGCSWPLAQPESMTPDTRSPQKKLLFMTFLSPGTGVGFL